MFASGDIDASYGAGGVVQSPNYIWNASALQSNGKLVLVGTVVNPNSGNDVAVMRLNANGF